MTKEDTEYQDYMKNRHIFLQNNKLYVLGQFNQDISNNIIPQMDGIIADLSGTIEPEFEIIINSPGGYTNDLLSLLFYLDLMKKANIKIITKNIGEASSCAAMLACYGDERYMGSRSTFLLHYGQYPVSPFTNLSDIDRQSTAVRNDFEWTAQLYAKNSNRSISQIKKMLESDHLTLDSKKCLEYGFVDKII